MIFDDNRDASLILPRKGIPANNPAFVTFAIAIPVIVSLLAVITVVPSAIAVNIPVFGSIVPIDVSLLLHVIGAYIGSPNWSNVSAVNISE